MEHQSDAISRNNLLACTTDARKAGLDYRLINPLADDYGDSKINKLVENVFNEYKLWEADRGTQLIFCDLSTPKKHSQKVTIDTQAIKEDSNDRDFENINDALEGGDEEVNK